MMNKTVPILMVLALLAAPGLDVNAADGDGRTALDLAETRGHIEVTFILPSRRRRFV